MRFFSATWELLKVSYREWSAHNAPRLGAALAYYTVLSLAPLAVMTLAIVSFVFTRESAQAQIDNQVTQLMGSQAAHVVGNVLRSAQQPAKGIVAGTISFFMLLVGASGVLSELRDSMNIIWNASPPNTTGILAFVRYRVVSFAMVLGVGFLLLVSLLLSTAVSAVGRFFSGRLPFPELVLQWFNFALSFLVVTLLFAFIYKFIPDHPIAWKDVWPGAAMTALLFDIGKTLLGIYLGKTTSVSAYGAAGSVVVLLIWVYYSAQILFFGAEFTQEYACRYGSLHPSACKEAPAEPIKPPETEAPPKTRTAP